MKHAGTPPAAIRVRPTPWAGHVALAVAAFALFLLYLFRPAPGNFLTATVVLNNEVIAQYPLSSLSEPVTLYLEELDYPLTIQAERGRIRISESSCPGEDCVHTGWVSVSGGQIVCLPNRRIISVTGSEAPAGDGVTG